MKPKLNFTHFLKKKEHPSHKQSVVLYDDIKYGPNLHLQLSYETFFSIWLISN